MRVALIGDEFTPDVGGAPTYAAGLSSALAKLVDVELLTHWHKGQVQEEKIHGVKIRRLKGFVLPRFNRAASPSIFSKLYREIKRRNYTIIHSLDLYSSMGTLSVWTANKIGATSVFTCHTAYSQSALIHSAHAPLVKFLKSAKGIIAVSESAKEFCIRLGFPKSKIFVVPNGIDTSVFNPKKSGKNLRKKLEIQNTPLVVTASRLTKRKGIHNLIKSFSNVLNKFPDAKLVIAGAGAQLPQLKELSKKLKIENSVLFVGALPHNKIAELLAAADVCVMPSKIETFSLLALESLAVGTPFVGPNVGGITSIIQNEVNGVLVPPGDTKKLSDAIVKIISDKKFRRRLQKTGPQFVRKNFSWEVSAKKTLEVYKNLTEAN